MHVQHEKSNNLIIQIFRILNTTVIFDVNSDLAQFHLELYFAPLAITNLKNILSQKRSKNAYNFFFVSILRFALLLLLVDRINQKSKLNISVKIKFILSLVKLMLHSNCCHPKWTVWIGNESRALNL